MALTNDGGWIDDHGIIRFRGFTVMSVDGRHCGFGARLVEADIDANIRQTLAAMRQLLGCNRRPSLLDRQLRQAKGRQ